MDGGGVLRNVTPARQPLPRGQLLSWVAASVADLRPGYQKAPTGDFCTPVVSPSRYALCQ